MTVIVGRGYWPFLYFTYINKRFCFNNFIKAEQVRVIDEDGKNIGVFPTSEAIKMAKEKGLDLVEITANTNPPIAKITDFGKLVYQQTREEKKQRSKQKKDDLKKIRLTFKMGQHDLDVKRDKIEEFLKDGMKVQVELFLRVREKTQKNLAKHKLQDFMATIREEYKVSGEIKQSNNSFFAVISK